MAKKKNESLTEEVVTSEVPTAEAADNAAPIVVDSPAFSPNGNFPVDEKPGDAPNAVAPQATGDDFVRRDPEEVVGKVVVLTNGIIVDRVQRNERGGFRYVGYYVGNVDTTQAMVGKVGEPKYFNADQISDIAAAK